MLKMSSFYFIVLYMKANQKLLIEITSNSSKANMRKWKKVIMKIFWNGTKIAESKICNSNSKY